MKEQLESKDLHLEMLRKKVSTLEDGLANRSALEREKDDEFVRNRKLTKLVERYKRELSEMHATVRELKAMLLESSEIKVRHVNTFKSSLKWITQQWKATVPNKYVVYSNFTEK